MRPPDVRHTIWLISIEMRIESILLIFKLITVMTLCTIDCVQLTERLSLTDHATAVASGSCHKSLVTQESLVELLLYATIS